jgi:ketosteroid isomerase-like protein
MRHTPMRTYLSFVLIAYLGLLCAPLPAQEKSDAATVRALEVKWAESYKQRNIEILSTLLADEFVITVEDGSVFSKAGYISHTADSKTHVQIADFSDLKVRVIGDIAVVTGSYHEKGESSGKAYDYHDRLTDVWMKSGGRWKVVASHYSVPYKP